LAKNGQTAGRRRRSICKQTSVHGSWLSSVLAFAAIAAAAAAHCTVLGMMKYILFFKTDF
jgi:hypothetical protein